jgi:hypothetical protein
VPRPLFAYALDAVPPALVEEWIAQGLTPNLARLRGRGAWGPIGKGPQHPHEASWSMFLQGCAPAASGEWGRHAYRAERYALEDRPTYALVSHPPFFADLGAPAVLFDLPHTGALPGLPGTQLQGWGVEENLFQAASVPPELFRDVVQRHGPHGFFGGASARTFTQEGQGEVTTFRLPCIYDPQAMADLEAQTLRAVATRQAILSELLDRHPWRLALAVSAELHLAMHMFWGEPGPVARVARAVDAALGAHLAALPAEADIAVFSVMGMTACYTDLTCNLFLPEFLYRLQFGEAALAEGDPAAPVPEPACHYRRHWREEVWALRTAAGERDLESPEAQGARNDPFDWTPLSWYRPMWPRMRAFALPSFSHGLVRLNLRGRDPEGLVEPGDYEATCAELTEAIRTLRNPRTGGALVKSVTRLRRGPEDAGDHAPPGDLLVAWNEREPSDVAQSPLAGRIGPAPWLRPGGHGPDGFCILAGPGIPPASHIREGATLMDLTATLTARLGLPAPAHLEGRSLVSP